MKLCIVCGHPIDRDMHVDTDLGEVCPADQPTSREVMVLGRLCYVTLWSADQLTRIGVTSALWSAQKGSDHLEHAGFDVQADYWHCHDCGIYTHPY